MSIITKINGIPLFKDEKRARLWGAHYGLTGSHTHVYNGITGFMAGSSHDQSVSGVFKSGKAPAEVVREYNKRNQSVAIPRIIMAQAQRQAPQPILTPQPTPQQTARVQVQPIVAARQPVTPQTYSTGGSSGGGGGGGGGY